MLGQEAASPLVIEDGMATAELCQSLPHALLELINFNGEQGRCSFTKSLGPLIVVHASHVEVALQDAFLDQS
jgi:hypothetical protein